MLEKIIYSSEMETPEPGIPAPVAANWLMLASRSYNEGDPRGGTDADQALEEQWESQGLPY